MLIPLTLASVILFLYLELGGDKVHVEEFLLPLRSVKTEVLWESYILVYKLIVMGLIVVECIRVGKTGVNAYMIRIML